MHTRKMIAKRNRGTIGSAKVIRRSSMNFSMRPATAGMRRRGPTKCGCADSSTSGCWNGGEVQNISECRKVNTRSAQRTKRAGRSSAEAWKTTKSKRAGGGTMVSNRRVSAARVLKTSITAKNKVCLRGPPPLGHRPAVCASRENKEPVMRNFMGRNRGGEHGADSLDERITLGGDLEARQEVVAKVREESGLRSIKVVVDMIVIAIVTDKRSPRCSRSRRTTRTARARTHHCSSLAGRSCCR